MGGRADDRLGLLRISGRVRDDLARRTAAAEDRGRAAMFWVWDVATDEVAYSSRLREVVGLSDGDARLDAYLDRVHAEDRGRVASTIRADHRCGEPFHVEHRLRVGPETFAWTLARGHATRAAHGSHVLMVVTLDGLAPNERADGPPSPARTDTAPSGAAGDLGLAEVIASLSAEKSERERAESELEASRILYHSLVESVPYAIFRKDRDGRYTFGNRRYCELHGTDLAGLIGKTDYDLYPEELARKYREDDRRTIVRREVLDLEEDHLDPNHPGGRQVVHTIKCPIYDADGRPAGIQGMFADVTERRKSRELLEYQATHDSLTGLANRALFYQRLEEATAAARLAGASLAVLLIDLDRFKGINDTFGHHYGDLVLQAVGPRFKAILRAEDVIARLGGDEFGIVLPGCDRDGAHRIASGLVRSLGSPIVIARHRLDVGASIGVAMYPEHGMDRITLVRNADVAMYTAKKSQSEIAFFVADQSQYTPRRMALISDLRDAVEADQFLVHLQPKLDLATGHHCGAEALLRWRHPREGLILPGQFIPLAEQVGLIAKLDLRAIELALAAARDWPEAGVEGRVAVNLSASGLRDSRIAAQIARVVAESGASPTRLQVEVTESAMMEDPRQALDSLARLHDQGITTAIDDFGTGYSSLAYLKNLPVGEVKIDQSFVKEMARQGRDACIVRAVIDLGHNLGLRVTAEGVEDAETLALLADLGCDYAQGYHISRPLPDDQFRSWLAMHANGEAPMPRG